MAKYTTEPKAEVLADSVSPDGHRLTTMEVTMHRFVLAEFNTHRVFSRNSASSRAIPGRLHRKRVLNTPAMPLRWPQKQSGMQGGTSVPPEIQIESEAMWRQAADYAVAFAQRLDDLGIHKSVTNRLLEPFLWHTIIVTSTDWQNFFDLRDNELAQPEIAEPARLMRAAYEASEPTHMERDGWHRPLVNIDDKDEDALIRYFINEEHDYVTMSDMLNHVSAARCARVSYLTHEGERDVGKDIELYERLTSADPPHASPLEHVATPCECGYVATWNGDPFGNPDMHKGNFSGWDQLRHMETT